MSPRPILIVDDDPSDRELAKIAFSEVRCPYALAEARDGEEALSYLADHPNAALVLLDIKMPKMDGFEVLSRLRANPKHRDLPIIILSASNEDKDRKRAMALGADLFLTKPIDLRDSIQHARVAVELARVGRNGSRRG